MAALSKTQRRKRRLGIVGDVYAILIYTVLYIPVAVMMVFSFNDQKYNFYWNGFTTEWYGKLLENDALIGSLWYSLIIAVLATVISVVIGTLGALGLKRYEFKGKRFINSMLYVPIIVPEIVLAVALLIIFMNIGLSLGLGSILVGHCTFCIPYAVVTIKGRISGDGYELEEASMDLGANRIQTFLAGHPAQHGARHHVRRLPVFHPVHRRCGHEQHALRCPQLHPAGIDPVHEPHRRHSRCQRPDHHHDPGDCGRHAAEQRRQGPAPQEGEGGRPVTAHPAAGGRGGYGIEAVSTKHHKEADK